MCNTEESEVLLIFSYLGYFRGLCCELYSRKNLYKVPSVAVPVKFLLVVRPAAAGRYAEVLPVFTPPVFSQKDNLAQVIAVVRQLPVDGFEYSMPFVADIDDLAELTALYRAQGSKQAVPAFFPGMLYFGGAAQFSGKLAIALPPCLFAVLFEEIGPSGKHIAPQVVDNNGYAAAMPAGRSQELFFGELLH